MSSLVVSLEDVSVRLNGRVLLDRMSWQIRSDEHWAVIGANGSGKSTLVKAVCGDIPLCRGRITRYFESAGKVDAASGGSLRGSIELVSFDSLRKAFKREGGFYQARWNSMSEEDSPKVSEFLSEEGVYRINPFEIRPRRSDPARFQARREEVVALTGIQGLLDKRLVQLSSGEIRKLLIARALLRNPRLLILDNPFTGLDSESRGMLNTTLAGLMNGSMRVMVVATRPDEIPSGITHALVVRDHRVLVQGPVGQIIEGTAAGSIWREEPSMPHRRNGSSLTGSKRSAPVLVHMRDVCIRYGDREVLGGVHWTIRRGERWALMGKNGSGKSTLLGLILGDNPQAYANDIRLFGKPGGAGQSIWEIKRRIGYVSPELHAYFPRRMSCLDVVCSGLFDSVGLYRSCSSTQERKASGWIERMGIGRCRDEPFQRLSEGEQRLCLLARAFIKRPRLLVLDEPCQGLDVLNRRRFLRMVEDAGERADALIFVTHIPEELPRVITHRLVLDSGRVVETGVWQGSKEEWNNGIVE